MVYWLVIWKIEIRIASKFPIILTCFLTSSFSSIFAGQELVALFLPIDFTVLVVSYIHKPSIKDIHTFLVFCLAFLIFLKHCIFRIKKWFLFMCSCLLGGYRLYGCFHSCNVRWFVYCVFIFTGRHRHLCLWVKFLLVFLHWVYILRSNILKRYFIFLYIHKILLLL